jgi:hypothetical protein
MKKHSDRAAENMLGPASQISWFSDLRRGFLNKYHQKLTKLLLTPVTCQTSKEGKIATCSMLRESKVFRHTPP